MGLLGISMRSLPRIDLRCTGSIWGFLGWFRVLNALHLPNSQITLPFTTHLRLLIASMQKITSALPTGLNQSKARTKVCTTSKGFTMPHSVKGSLKEAPKVIGSSRRGSTLRINSMSESFKMLKRRPQ